MIQQQTKLQQHSHAILPLLPQSTHKQFAFCSKQKTPLPTKAYKAQVRSNQFSDYLISIKIQKNASQSNKGTFFLKEKRKQRMSRETTQTLGAAGSLRRTRFLSAAAFVIQSSAARRRRTPEVRERGRRLAVESGEKRGWEIGCEAGQR